MWTIAPCHRALHAVVIELPHPVVRPLGRLPECYTSTQPGLNLLFLHFISPGAELQIQQ